MNRPLVLTNDIAGHPLRRRLPPPARPATSDAVRDDDADWRLFLLSFAAFFTCFYTLIC